MTEQTDKTRSQPVEDVAGHTASAAPAGISRRDMLRGATVAVPTILTLHSGTALALASAGAKVSPSAEPGRIGDNYVCLETTGKVGPPYDVSPGTNAKAVPVFYEYVSTDELLGVNLTDPKDISDAIKKRRIRPLKANQLCSRKATSYVPVVYDAKNGKYQPLRRGGGTVVASMPSTANMSATAAASVMATGGVNMQFLV